MATWVASVGGLPAVDFETHDQDRVIPLCHDAGGEVCFYLTKTREQFRVRGRLQVIAVGEADEKLAKARRSQWTQISPAARASFVAPLMPGSEMSPEQVTEAESRRSSRGDPAPLEAPEEPTDDFCLVLLWPHCVDHLELRDGQRRRVHTLLPEGGHGEPHRSNAEPIDMVRQAGRSEGTWKTTEVVP